MKNLNFPIPEGFKSEYKEFGLSWWKDLAKFQAQMLDAVTKPVREKKLTVKGLPLKSYDDMKSSRVKSKSNSKAFENSIKLNKAADQIEKTATQKVDKLWKIIDDLVKENLGLKNEIDWNYGDAIDLCLGFVKALYKARKSYSKTKKSSAMNFSNEKHWKDYRNFVDKNLRTFVREYLEKHEKAVLTLQEQILLTLCDPFFVWNLKDRNPIVDLIALGCCNTVIKRHPKFNWKTHTLPEISSLGQLMSFLENANSMTLFNRNLLPDYFLGDKGLTRNPDSWPC